MKELTARFFVKTDGGTIPLEEATQEQKDELGKKILLAAGKVMCGE